MNQDQIFRIALALCVAAFSPIAVFHRLRSQATGERLDRWQEGPFILFTLRPVGLTCLLGFLAFLISPSWMAWSSVPLPDALRWLGVGLALLAGGLVTWAFRHLGNNLTDTVVTRRVHALVTTGPYRWVRHPFYDAVALWIAAGSLAAANWFILLSGGLAFALILLRTRKEEEKLMDRFGEPYRAYAGRTGRFLPRIRGNNEHPGSRKRIGAPRNRGASASSK